MTSQASLLTRIAIGALSLMTGLLIGFFVLLFGNSNPGEKLGAVAAVIGGLVGAGGAALAVYLTLDGQRQDEAEKVEAALRMEVAEHARLVIGALGVCELVMTEGLEIPLHDLPGLMQIPDAPVYKSTADRISRLPYGSLFVVFHARIAEALQMVRIYATAPPPPARGLQPERIARIQEAFDARRLLDREKAKTLATAWYDACTVGKTILRRDVDAQKIAEAAIAETLVDLDAVERRVGPVVAESPAGPTSS